MFSGIVFEQQSAATIVTASEIASSPPRLDVTYVAFHSFNEASHDDVRGDLTIPQDPSKGLPIPIL